MTVTHHPEPPPDDHWQARSVIRSYPDELRETAETEMLDVHPDDGPSVQECAAADRRWDVEQGGE
jgi:hypothetical protein